MGRAITSTKRLLLRNVSEGHGGLREVEGGRELEGWKEHTRQQDPANRTILCKVEGWKVKGSKSTRGWFLLDPANGCKSTAVLSA